MDALANAIGLRALGLGAGMVDVLNGEIELVFVALRAAKLGAAIGQHARQADAVLVNQRRPHQGRWCFGKTPMQTFLDALPLAKVTPP